MPWLRPAVKLHDLFDSGLVAYSSVSLRNIIFLNW